MCVLAFWPIAESANTQRRFGTDSHDSGAIPRMALLASSSHGGRWYAATLSYDRCATQETHGRPVRRVEPPVPRHRRALRDDRRALRSAGTRDEPPFRVTQRQTRFARARREPPRGLARAAHERARTTVKRPIRPFRRDL